MSAVYRTVAYIDRRTFFASRRVRSWTKIPVKRQLEALVHSATGRAAVVTGVCSQRLESVVNGRTGSGDNSEGTSHAAHPAGGVRAATGAATTPARRVRRTPRPTINYEYTIIGTPANHNSLSVCVFHACPYGAHSMHKSKYNQKNMCVPKGALQACASSSSCMRRYWRARGVVGDDGGQPTPTARFTWPH